MNPDRKKLMQILENLERDYEAGLISEEKYLYLSDQYKHKIETIEVSDRIRAMQGKEETPSSLNSHVDSEKYQEEKEKLVRKYIHNPESYTVSKKPDESTTASPWYIALAVVFLLVAFVAGITFGMSSIGLGSNDDDGNMFSASATINDTAFPEVKVNKSLSYNYTKSYSNTTSYGSSDDSSSSSSSSSSISDSGSSSSSSSGSGSSGDYSGGSSSGGGSSGGSSDSGSSGGGSSGGSSGGGSSGGGSSGGSSGGTEE